MKNQIHKAEIIGYSSDGAGVCRIYGHAVFVPHAIFGELCEIKILKVTASAAFGKLERIITPSHERIVPACECYSRCGGCDLMHMSYDEELRFKKRRVEDALRRIGGLDVGVGEIIGAQEIVGYRNKAIYAVGSGGVGFYRKRSHDVLPVERCLIQPEASDRAAAAVWKFMREHGIKAYDERTKTGCVRHVFVRCAFRTGEAMVCVAASKGFGAATPELVEVLRAAVPECKSIALCVNKSVGNTVLSGDFHTLWGSDTITEMLCGFRFELSAQSFFQINPPQAEILYAKTVEYVGTCETLLDLYCGAGTISLCLASNAKLVIGAEIVEPAVLDARKNAARNGVLNVEFICADASDVAAELLRRGVQPDAAVVDPPRKGLAAAVIDALGEISPARIAYVSCDPATLARDLKRFVELGYSVNAVTAVDMFPRTRHVETVALLQRQDTKKLFANGADGVDAALRF